MNYRQKTRYRFCRKISSHTRGHYFHKRINICKQYYAVGVDGGVITGAGGTISSSSSSFACLILALIANTHISIKNIPAPIPTIRSKIFRRPPLEPFAAATGVSTILISAFGQVALAIL